jgi:hypothetical protein
MLSETDGHGSLDVLGTEVASVAIDTWRSNWKV